MEGTLPLFAFNTQRVRVQSWAEETTEATLNSQLASGTSVKLEIPLDSALPIRTRPSIEVRVAADQHTSNIRDLPRPAREPVRRDSLKRREALLKGNEGSRRRQRWENGLS